MKKIIKTTIRLFKVKSRQSTDAMNIFKAIFVCNWFLLAEKWFKCQIKNVF